MPPIARELTSDPARGVPLVLAAAVLWGTTGTAQTLVPVQLSSAWVGALRLVFAGLFFLPALGAIARDGRGARALAALPWRQVLLAAGCMGLYNLAFFAGVRALGVAAGTAVALGSGPLWAGLLQAIAGGGRPSRLWWAGTGVAVLGAALMVAGPGATGRPSALGLGGCLLAGLAYAGYALVSRRMVTAAPASAVTAAVFVSAALLALPPAWALAGAPALRGPDLAVLAWLGVMSTGVAYLLFGHGLRHLPAATAVALALAEPVTAFALAIVVVGERPGPLAFAGLLAVVGGLAAVIRAETAAGVRRGAGR